MRGDQCVVVSDLKIGADLVALTFEEKQRQVAVAAVMVVVEGQLLLAVGAVFGVLHIQDDHRGRLGITGDEGLDERLRQAVDILARAGVLQAGKGRTRSQVVTFGEWSLPQWRPFDLNSRRNLRVRRL